MPSKDQKSIDYDTIKRIVGEPQSPLECELFGSKRIDFAQRHFLPFATLTTVVLAILTPHTYAVIVGVVVAGIVHHFFAEINHYNYKRRAKIVRAIIEIDRHYGGKTLTDDQASLLSDLTDT